MKKIEDALSVLRPWFDNPATQAVTVSCLASAAHAGHFRRSQNAQTRAKGDAMLGQMSEVLLIPHSVLETYADGMAALNTYEGFEWLMSKIGGKHDQ
ncbi:hypothetical protein PPGU19_001350 [Paraburkholderia sp. PGU19]|uniref:hypothetical protein n=1 Tax=Paraburkholderia sp. PGU19 TaxID=2735434 RepID=UPI0015DA764E|nr:hypothetical protein [Paraburkholderia sp. PGU19]BCF95566.1 hypothetical protein PPGU19_001350 [Paraburkholderia sp. PGU19]